RVVEELPVNQGKLVMGFRLGATDMETEYEKYKIMCDVFGGGVHSRLFNVVREEMSLCYYCSSRCVRDKEFMMVQSGIENENAEVAEKEILNQLQYVVNDLTEDDLEKSKLSMKDMLATVCDTPDDIMGWMLSQAQEEFVTPEEHLEKLMAVTLEDVRSAAAAVTLDTVYLLKGTGEVQS
ncbi:MAG: insulinase family protein, partial [Clostridia bacterium]|nr:insulinase family protein [Clostridia bacterium]